MTTNQPTLEERISEILEQVSISRDLWGPKVLGLRQAEGELVDMMRALRAENERLRANVPTADAETWRKACNEARAERDAARTQTRLLATSARRELSLRWKPAWPAVEPPETVNARWDLLEKIRLILGEEER